MKNIINIIILLLFLSFSAHTKISPEDFKGTFSIFQDSYQKLSPLPGAIWVEGGILENLGEIRKIDEKNRPAESAIINIIQSFFKRVDLSDYRPSDLPTIPVYYLTPRILGTLASKLLLLEESAEKKTKINVEKETKNISAWLLDTYDTLKLSKNDSATLRKKTNNFAKWAVQSIINKSPNVSIWKLIASILYFKSNDKKDLYDYLAAINNAAIDITYDRSKIFRDTTIFDDGGKIWQATQFSKADKSDDIRKMIGDYEILAFNALRITRNWLDPYLTQYRSGAVISGDRTFSDCGENSLFNLYKILFAKTDLSMNIELIKKIGRPAGKLLKFFDTPIIDKDKNKLDPTSLKDLRNSAAHDAWDEMLADLNKPGQEQFIYSQKECSIRAGFGNMENFLRFLTGTDNLDDFVAQYNEASPTIQISIEKNIDNNLGTVRLKRDDLPQAKFIWHFQPQHFYIESTTDAPIFPIAINTLLTSPQPIFDVAALFKKNLYEESIYVETMKEMGKNDPYVWLLQRMKSDDDLIEYGQTLLVSNCCTALGLVKRMPTDSRGYSLVLRSMIVDRTSTIAQVMDYLLALGMINRTDLLARLESNIIGILPVAVSTERLEYVQALLKYFPKEYFREAQGGIAALHRAARARNFEILKLLSPLLDKEAFNTIDEDGNSILLNAIKEDKPADEAETLAIFEFLMEKMSQEAIDHPDLKQNLPASFKAIINNPDLKYPLPLSVLNLLLSRTSSKFFLKNENLDPFNSLLNMIARFPSHSVEILDMLLKYMPKEAMTIRDQEEETALTIAVRRSFTDKVKSLIRFIDPQHIDEEAKKALLVALSKRPAEMNQEIINFLIPSMSREALSQADEDGQTPLYRAIQNFAPVAVIKLLLEKMSSDSLQLADYSSKKTALQLARETEQKDIVEVLLKYTEK